MSFPAAGSGGGNTTGVREYCAWGAAFFLSLYFLFFASRAFDLAIDVGDEGVAAVQSWRISEGWVPGADLFEIIPPVSFLVPALSVKLLGPTIFAQRIVTLLYGALLLLLTDALISRYTREWIPRALAALFLIPYGVYYWPMASHHWAVDLLQIGALLFLESAFRTPRTRLFGWAAGVFSGLALFSLQDQGGLFMVALVLCVYLPARLKRTLPRGVTMAFLLGFSLVAGVMALWLLPKAGLGALCEQWALFPLENYKRLVGNQSDAASVLSYFESLLRGPSFARAPVSTSAFLMTQGLAALFLPLATPLLLVLLSRGQEEGYSLRFALLFAGCIAFLGTGVRRYEISNMNWALPLPLVALAWFLGLALVKGGWPRRVALGFAGLFGVAALVVGLQFALVRCAPGKTGEVYAPAGRVRFLSLRRAEEVQGAVDAISHFVPAKAPIFCFGYAPMVNYLTQRPNPTPYTFIISPQYHTPEHVVKWSESLEDKGVSWGVGLAYPDVPGDLASEYLREKFEVVWTNGAFVLWRRRG